MGMPLCLCFKREERKKERKKLKKLVLWDYRLLAKAKTCSSQLPPNWAWIACSDKFLRCRLSSICWSCGCVHISFPFLLCLSLFPLSITFIHSSFHCLSLCLFTLPLLCVRTVPLFAALHYSVANYSHTHILFLYSSLFFAIDAPTHAPCLSLQLE